MGTNSVKNKQYDKYVKDYKKNKNSSSTYPFLMRLPNDELALFWLTHKVEMGKTAFMYNISKIHVLLNNGDFLTYNVEFSIPYFAYPTEVDFLDEDKYLAFLEKLFKHYSHRNQILLFRMLKLYHYISVYTATKNFVLGEFIKSEKRLKNENNN